MTEDQLYTLYYKVDILCMKHANDHDNSWAYWNNHREKLNFFMKKLFGKFAK